MLTVLVWCFAVSIVTETEYGKYHIFAHFIKHCSACKTACVLNMIFVDPSILTSDCYHFIQPEVEHVFQSGMCALKLFNKKK